MLFILAIGFALAPGPAELSKAQEFVTVIESESFPLDNRLRTVIVERDLTPRSYRIAVKRHMRVVDNHDEIVARRSAHTFDSRFRQSLVARHALFDMYDRLSR